MNYLFSQLFLSLTGQPFDGMPWHNTFWWVAIGYSILWLRADRRYKNLARIVTRAVEMADEAKH